MPREVSLDMDVSAVDLLDLDRWAEAGPPHDWFARMRDTAPVWHHRSRNGPGFWVVSSYEHVVALGRRPEDLSSDEDFGGVAGLGAGDELQAVFDESFSSGVEDAKQLLSLDPPEHTVHRRLLSRRFTPRSVVELEPTVRELARELLDQHRTGEPFDFTTEVAMPLPMQVIGDLLGVDRHHHADLLRWSNEAVGGTDWEYDAGPGAQLNAATQLATLYLAMREDFDPLAKSESTSLVDLLCRAEVGGEPLSPVRFVMHLLLLTTAGNETTRNAMSHGMAAFADHPDQWLALREDRSLVPSAVEEVLRWSSPVLYFRRNARRPVEVAGERIEPGDIVSLWYVSANRDREVFDAPDTFDVTRTHNPHVAFGGGGAHYCLGAALARLEIRVLLEEMLERYAVVERAGPIERLRSNFLNGIKHLPLRLGG